MKRSIFVLITVIVFSLSNLAFAGGGGGSAQANLSSLTPAQFKMMDQALRARINRVEVYLNGLSLSGEFKHYGTQKNFPAGENTEIKMDPINDIEPGPYRLYMNASHDGQYLFSADEVIVVEAGKDIEISPKLLINTFQYVSLALPENIDLGGKTEFQIQGKFPVSSNFSNGNFGTYAQLSEDKTKLLAQVPVNATELYLTIGSQKYQLPTAEIPNAVILNLPIYLTSCPSTTINRLTVNAGLLAGDLAAASSLAPRPML